MREGLFVFHRQGACIGIGALRSGWKLATKRAGLAGRLVYDLRRTAARDFRRAGVDEGTIMGVRHREWPVHGVQFHPESILTAQGMHLLRNFLEM